MNTQDVTLDLSKTKLPNQIVRIGQGDKAGTTIRATILDNGVAANLTGMTAIFKIKLPDRGYYEDSNCTVTGNVITHVLNEDYSASASGYTDDAYFTIVNGQTKYSTSRFRVKVEKDAASDADPAHSYTDNITQATIDARAAADAANDAADRIEGVVDDAEAAVENATAAVTAANTAVTAANTANDRATTAAATATSAANAATQAASSANAATTSANTATTNANSAAQRTEAAIAAVGDISRIAVPLMSEDVRGGAELGVGLEVNDGALGIGSLAPETDGTIYGPLAEVRAKGWSEQAKTVGKNLAQPNQAVVGGIDSGVTWTNLGSGLWELDGTNSASTAKARSFKMYDCGVLASGTYTVTVERVSGTSQKSIIPRLGTGSDATIFNDFTTVESSAARSVRTFTADGSTQFWACIQINGNDVLSDAIFRLQLELGSTSTSYEPYSGGAPSPSPDYPQPITCAGGRNLLDANGEHSTAGSGYLVAQTALTLEAGAYILTGEFVGTVDTSKQWQLIFYDASGTQLQTKAAAHGSPITVTLNQATARVALYTNAKATVRDIMLRAGSVAHGYVPYGAYAGLDVKGKNLFAYVYSAVHAGISYDYLGDGSVTVRGTASTASGIAVATLVSEGKTITLEAGTYTVSIRGLAGVGAQVYSSSSTQLANTGVVQGTGVASRTFTLNASTTVVLRANVGSGTTVNGTAYIQLEPGSTATKYVPYFDSTAAVPLPPSGEAAGLPDGTRDELTIDAAGHVTWVQRIGKVVLDGSESGWVRAATKPAFYINLPLAKSSINNSNHGNVVGISSHFVDRGSYNNGGDTDGSLTWAYTSNHTSACFTYVALYSSASDTSAWTAWLASNPVTVYYPLATPITHDLGYIDMPDVLGEGTASIAEMEGFEVSSFIDVATADAMRAWYERVIGAIEDLQQAVAELATA